MPFCSGDCGAGDSRDGGWRTGGYPNASMAMGICVDPKIDIGRHENAVVTAAFSFFRAHESECAELGRASPSCERDGRRDSINKPTTCLGLSTDRIMNNCP